MSFKCIRFDHFYAAYPNCSSLYLGSDFPKNKESTPGTTYPTDIVPQFLYLGSFYDATDKAIMTELGFTHVIDATSEHMSAQTSQELGLNYLHIPVWDMEGVNIAEHFPSVLSFIHAAKDRNGKILVHCRAGISRSATLVLAYLMHAGLVQNLKHALELVIDQRPYIMPNPSFRTQLLDYEMSIFRRQSFEDEGKMQEFMATINFCWSGIFTRETDHDKIPIIAATQRININRLLDAYPAVDDTAVATCGDGDNAAGTKPKKAFLKRGEGKAVATRLKQPATRCSSALAAAPAATPTAAATPAAATPAAAAADVTEYAASGESVGVSD
jgi:protein-tyrosine phosphatase